MLLIPKQKYRIEDVLLVTTAMERPRFSVIWYTVNHEYWFIWRCESFSVNT